MVGTKLRHILFQRCHHLRRIQRGILAADQTVQTEGIRINQRSLKLADHGYDILIHRAILGLFHNRQGFPAEERINGSSL